jgi:hypothetical protein
MRKPVLPLFLDGLAISYTSFLSSVLAAHPTLRISMHMSAFGEFSFETYYFKLVLQNQAAWRMLNLEFNLRSGLRRLFHISEKASVTDGEDASLLWFPRRIFDEKASGVVLWMNVMRTCAILQHVILWDLG